MAPGLTGRRDPAETARALRVWLAEMMPTATGIAVSDVVVPSSGGLSNDTVLFRARWRDGGPTGPRRGPGLVARIEAVGGGVHPDHDIAREHHVLSVLAARTDVPVPAIRGFEPDPAWLGAPFLVMDQVAGRVPDDDPPYTTAGWLLDLDPAGRRRLHDHAVGVLARIHAVPWRELDLAALEPDGDRPTEAARLDRLRRFQRFAARDREYPLITAAFDWLERHRPAESAGRTVLSWGDARIGNMLFDTDLRVAGVLDWELVGLARPEVDLGWWQFMHLLHTDAIGVRPPAGFPTFAETLRAYRAASGHTPTDMEYHLVLAGLRVCLVLVRAAHMMTDAGVLPPEATLDRANPATVLLARLIGHTSRRASSTGRAGSRAPRGVSRR